MAYYPDLSICKYIALESEPNCLAVGWLDPFHDFNQDDVTPEFFDRLCQLLVRPWNYVRSFGVHECRFCRFSGGGSVRYKNYSIQAHGNELLFVPSGEIIYISPSSIAHYIDAHGYCPPLEYQRAVMECPEMRSMAYLQALLATPVQQWIQKTDNFLSNN